MRPDTTPLAPLIARDPELPGLAVLLDDERVRAAAAEAFPDLSLRSARRTYTRYKHATNCLCLFEVERADGERELLTGKTFSAATSHKREKVLRTIRAGNRHAALAEPALEFTRLPFDPKLPSLQPLFDPATRPALLEDVFPDDPARHRSEVELLAYKPERRAVTRLVDERGREVSLKVHSERRHEESSRKLIRFVSRGDLRLPRRVASSSGHGIVVGEWLEGDLLADALTAGHVDADALERVGAALGALQDQDPQHLELTWPQQRAAATLAMAEALRRLDPDLGDRAAPIARHLAARLEAEPVDAVPIHGDFYAKQVLLTPDSVSFIDLDAAARGGAYDDVGSFLAHLDREVVRGHLTREQAGVAGESLLAGLGRGTGQLPAGGPALRHAAALFGLLGDPFRRNEPSWIERTHALLDQVEQLAAALTPAPARRRRSPAPTWPFDPESPDPKIPLLGPALEPARAAEAIEAGAFPQWTVSVHRAELVRHKPGRRALIDYTLALEGPSAPDRPVRALGKLRRRRIDYYAYRLGCSLKECGFSREAGSPVITPEPLGLVPDLQMWLQRFEAGQDIAPLLLAEGAPALAERIAEALHRVHAAPLPCVRTQRLADELEILETQLTSAAAQLPDLAARIAQTLEAAQRLASRIGPAPETGIHRDFHPDQVLASDDALVLLDFDLFSRGDPSIDAGNFSAHIQELALRERGDVDALADVRGAFEQRFLELTPTANAADLERHRVLAFLRHVAISQRIPERRSFAEAVLAAAEEALAEREAR